MINTIPDKIPKAILENLPKYAIPLFIRFLSELSTTSTFKIQKSNMKKVGFDITKTKDPIYVLLPKSSEFTLLNVSDIIKEEYRF